jgi:hypothetical protein
MIDRVNLAYLRLQTHLRDRIATMRRAPDAGVTTAEYIMWVGIAVAAAIAVGAIVTALLKGKANSLKLN